MALGVSVKLVALALVIALFSGCGNEKQPASPLMQAVGAVAKATLDRSAAKRNGGTAAAAKPATREDLEAFGTPILRAVVSARGVDTLLAPTDVKGDIVTWSTSDGTTFTLSGGVLIQTRGLGPDLMSAQAPTVTQLMTQGGTHQRIYFFLGPDDQGTRRSYDCTVAIDGKTTIEIMGRNHTVAHVVETCSRPQGSISNEYWIEGSTVRKSRQLLSGGAGYVDFEKIVD